MKRAEDQGILLSEGVLKLYNYVEMNRELCLLELSIYQTPYHHFKGWDPFGCTGPDFWSRNPCVD